MQLDVPHASAPADVDACDRYPHPLTGRDTATYRLADLGPVRR